MMKLKILLLLSYALIFKGEMKLEKVGQTEIKRSALAVETSHGEESIEFVSGVVHNREYFMINNLYGISRFSSGGDLINSTKIAKAIKPHIQQFLDDSTYLLHSPHGLTTGIWTTQEIEPKLYLKADNGMWYFATQYDDRKNVLVAFPSVYYTFKQEFLSSTENMTMIFLIELTSDLERNGSIIQEIQIPKAHAGLPVLGRRLEDGRLFILVSPTSKMLEFNREYEHIFTYDQIPNYKASLAYEISVANSDQFTDNYPMPLYNNKYLVALRNAVSPKGCLDIWDIESRRYVGGFEIGESLLLDADDQFIYLVDSIGEEAIEIGKYNLDIDAYDGAFLSTFKLKDPMTKKTYTLGSVLSAYDDKLMIIFTAPGDCTARSYIFDRQGIYFEKDESLPEALICYTEEDPVLLSSFMNSTRDKYWMCGNIDPALTRDMPYAVIIDRHTKIIQRLTRDEVGEMLKEF